MLNIPPTVSQMTMNMMTQEEKKKFFDLKIKQFPGERAMLKGAHMTNEEYIELYNHCKAMEDKYCQKNAALKMSWLASDN